MSSLHDFITDYAKRNPEWAERTRIRMDEFFGTVPDVAELKPVPWNECDQEHPALAGPNMDIGQCAKCWSPVGAMRPEGESFGWHRDDCSLPMRHAGYCEPGGTGHTIPEGWKLRG